MHSIHPLGLLIAAYLLAILRRLSEHWKGCVRAGAAHHGHVWLLKTASVSRLKIQCVCAGVHGRDSVEIPCSWMLSLCLCRYPIARKPFSQDAGLAILPEPPSK